MDEGRKEICRMYDEEEEETLKRVLNDAHGQRIQWKGEMWLYINYEKKRNNKIIM